MKENDKTKPAAVEMELAKQPFLEPQPFCKTFILLALFFQFSRT
jgi:hypothetical protein